MNDKNHLENFICKCKDMEDEDEDENWINKTQCVTNVWANT